MVGWGQVGRHYTFRGFGRIIPTGLTESKGLTRSLGGKNPVFSGYGFTGNIGGEMVVVPDRSELIRT